MSQRNIQARVSIAMLFVWLGTFAACQADPHQQSQSTDVPVPADSIRWATYSRQPIADRQAGIDRMLASDPEAFWQDAAAKARQIDDWPMIRLLCDRAANTRAAEALPWLVRSWAMPSKLVADEDRPERAAIRAVTAESARLLLHAIVFDDAVSHQPATQIAAWTVLVRIEPDATLRQSIAAIPKAKASLLVAMLQRVAPTVDVLPSDRIAIAQMMRLTTAYGDAQWQAFAQWRDTHTAAEPQTLALRHLPALAHRDTTRDAWSRKRWLDHIRSRLADRRHISRGQDADEDTVINQRPDRFADHAPALSTADLIVIDHLLNLMDDSAARRTLFEQARADRDDTSTEYGGAVLWDAQNTLVYKPFPALIKRHDQAYIASNACMQAVYLGLAHAHYHAQRDNNTPWAGPGNGDLTFANNNHVNAIVLTTIDANTMNIDVYFPGEVIIDLGCISQ